MGHRLWCETGYRWRTVSRRTDRLKHRKRGCEEMRIHFFTAPFYFAFIWFKVQGSGLRWRLRRLFLDGAPPLKIHPLPRFVIPSATEGSFLHGRHMHACALTQTTPWCFLLSPFSHSCFTGLQKGSLHFGPHDTQERRIVSHSFSYRCVELCLFEALYPAPSARPFSKGLLVSLL